MPVEDCWFTVTLCVLVKFIDLCGECGSRLSLFVQVIASCHAPCKMQGYASSLVVRKDG